MVIKKSYSPVIRDDFCKGCAICVEICPKKTLSISDELTINGYPRPRLIEMGYRVPPCDNACPSGEKIQEYIDLINQSTRLPDDQAGLSNIRKTWELLTADNPFPAVCGRVCSHPCEESCNRGDYDEPIGIHHIERFIGDVGLNESFNWKLPRLNRKYNVAIIGGGPSGLSCAYHLRRLGYQATIFESDNKLGGLLTQGIPSYRLPQNIVNTEINRIINTGICVNLNTRIGKDYDFDKLLSEYDAIFIAIGAHKQRKLNIIGEENQSVISALNFLYNLSCNKKVNIGERVGIIGGGNAAIDAARSVLRRGKKPVIIYRRTENEMPAIPDEIIEAKEEGIEFITLTAPKSIIIRNNKIIALECIRMKLGPVDESGRRRPIPIKNSNFKIKLDTIITAIGEEVDTEFLPNSLVDNNKIKVLGNRVQPLRAGADQPLRARAGCDGIRTPIKGVFAGGDAVTGPKTVVEALGAGKKAATLIHYYIKNEKPVQSPHQKSINFEDLNTTYFEHKVMTQPPKLPLSSRLNSFTEVYKGYTVKQISEECARCFNCGGCRTCLECELHCPDLAIEVK